MKNSLIKTLFLFLFILLNTFQTSSPMIAKRLTQGCSLEDVKSLLYGGNNINKRYAGYAPLHIACQQENRDLVQTLLWRSSLDINAMSKDGETALHIVTNTISEKSIAIAQLLISDPRIEINKPNADGNSCLHLACIRDNSEIIKKLLTHNDIDTYSESGLRNTLIELVSDRRNPDCMIMLLRHTPSLVAHPQNLTLYCIFKLLFSLPSEKIDGYLPDLPEECFFEADCNRNNFLHYACFHNKCIDFILDEYTSNNELDLINQGNINGNTPLHLCLCRHKTATPRIIDNESIKKLLDSGASSIIQNHNGCTPFLNSYCADIDQLNQENIDQLTCNDSNGNTHLHLCATASSRQLEGHIKFLITQRKLSIWEKNNMGQIATHIAYDFYSSFDNIEEFDNTKEEIEISRKHSLETLHKLSRAAAEHASYATFQEIMKDLLPEIRQLIAHYYHALNHAHFLFLK